MDFVLDFMIVAFSLGIFVFIGVGVILSLPTIFESIDETRKIIQKWKEERESKGE